jgi:hypothetical protein
MFLNFYSSLEDVNTYLEDEDWFDTDAFLNGEGEHTEVFEEEIGTTIEENGSGL